MQLKPPSGTLVVLATPLLNMNNFKKISLKTFKKVTFFAFALNKWPTTKQNVLSINIFIVREKEFFPDIPRKKP